MCGIAGYVGDERLPPDRIEACLRLMGRRGPDASGSYEHRGPGGRWVNLLHSRLAIIDLDPRANGPFRFGDHVLTYNGELYEYVELRAELERSGVPFRTSSDTEVVAAAIASGRAATLLGSYEGMWAFAAYDEGSGSLLLGRDRFGEKPLFLLREGSGLYFASEPKMLFALSGRRPSVNRDHLRRYLVNGYKALYKRPRTFFEGVGEVQPGTMMTLDPSGASDVTTYWAPKVAPEDGLSYEAAVDETREALTRALWLRLRADVPLAFCLSGGVDSNALIAVAWRVLGADVHGFTIANTDRRYAEVELVDRVVAELGIRHTYVSLDTEGFLGRLRELVRYHDAPVYTITYYAHWLLMEQIAAHGYKISLSGTAADELFSGYYDHHLAYLAAVREDPGRHAAAVEDWRRHVSPLVRNPFLSDPELFVREPQFRDHIYLGADTFASYLREPWSEPFAEEAYADELLRNRMLNELRHESVPVILHEDDRNAMYWSVENRSPFLDRGLFDVAARIPTRHLVRDGFAKAILRDAVRGLAPDAVIDDHRKVGFNAPIHGFLNTSDPGVRDELLADGPLFEEVRKDKFEALLDMDDLQNSESKFLFNLVNAKFFLEEFAS
jgi:asparagine synthase (glutamine-hydrolysing)